MDARPTFLHGRCALVLMGVLVACDALRAQSNPEWKLAQFRIVRNQGDFYLIAFPLFPSIVRKAPAPSFRFEKRNAEFEWVKHDPIREPWSTACLGSVWVFRCRIDADFWGRVILHVGDENDGSRVKSISVRQRDLDRRIRPAVYRYCTELLRWMNDDSAELRLQLLHQFDFGKMDREAQIAVCEAALRKPSRQYGALLSRVAARCFEMYVPGALIELFPALVSDDARYSLQNAMLVQDELVEIDEEIECARLILETEVETDRVQSDLREYVSKRWSRYMLRLHPVVRSELRERVLDAGLRRWRSILPMPRKEIAAKPYFPWRDIEFDWACPSWMKTPRWWGRLDPVVCVGRDGVVYVDVAFRRRAGGRTGEGWTDGIRILGPVARGGVATAGEDGGDQEWKAERRPGGELTFHAEVGTSATGDIIVLRDSGQGEDGKRIIERYVVRIGRRRDPEAAEALLDFGLKFIESEDATVRWLAGRALDRCSASGAHSARRKASGDRRAILERWCPGASRREWWWLDTCAANRGWSLGVTNRVYEIALSFVGRMERRQEESAANVADGGSAEWKAICATERSALVSQLREVLAETDTKKIGDAIASKL